MATFDEFYRSLDTDPNVRGQQFERFVAWFLKTSPDWASKVDEVWLWDEYPERWGPDLGIDLVFRHRDGELWAVQSKCVSPDKDLRKSEIDSFLSESSRASIHGRLLIASTDGIGRNLISTLKHQEKPLVTYLLEHFRAAAVDYPVSPDALTTGQRKPNRTPRAHQRKAIREVLHGLESADRGQLLMACGTGKTLTSLWIKEAMSASRALDSFMF
jgi:predicted helicase